MSLQKAQKTKNMEHEKLLKQFRKKPIAQLEDFPEKFNYDRDDIKKIIPHREPFLLIDKILGIDLDKKMIIGSRMISKNDPVFEGHFPDFPVYPGSLQLEMVGQMGLCLYYFLKNRSKTIMENANPLQIRATRIIGAHFLEPLLPGNEVLLIVRKHEHEAFFGSILGQVISEQTICSVSISEVCFIE